MKEGKKVVVILMVLCMVLFSLTACKSEPANTTGVSTEVSAQTSTGTSTETSSEVSTASYTIGFSLPSFEFTLFSAMQELYLAKCDEMGVMGQVFNAESNQEKQNKDIEDMVTMGFDAIIVCPITVEGAAPAMKYVNENNIPLFTVDRQVSADLGVDVVSHISVDQTEIGRMGARAFLQGMEEMFPDADQWIIQELEGTPGASSAIDRSNGINEILAQEPRIVKLPNLSANYDTNTAVSVTEDVLTSHPEVMGIIAANDMMIEGSLQALVNANRVGDILLVGMDGQSSTVEKILEGSIYATPTTTPLMASLALETAVKYLNGETVEPAVVAPSQLITAENAQEYLDSDLAW